MGEMDNVWTVERHLQDKRPEVIALYLDLPRLVPDARITRSAPYTKRLYVHHFRIDNPGQLDDQFAGWLGEAYQVGAGAHLDRAAGNRP